MADAPKETVMILKVDLQCPKCSKKVKKVLCKFPQIRDQVYDEKANVVLIKVFCCNPEKLRDKLFSKGYGSIKSIEIVKPSPREKPEKPKEPEKKPEKKPEKMPEEKLKPPTKPALPPADPAPPPHAPEQPVKLPSPIPPCILPPIWPCNPPIGLCCSDCYHRHTGGPCFQMGFPPETYGRPVYESWGGGCCDYFNEENTQACSIM